MHETSMICTVMQSVIYVLRAFDTYPNFNQHDTVVTQDCDLTWHRDPDGIP